MRAFGSNGMRWRLGVVGLLILNGVLAVAIGLDVGLDLEVPAWTVDVTVGVGIAIVGLVVRRQERR
jgi:hypothetical protein